MTGTQTQSIDQNIMAADRFLDQIAALPAVERDRIRRDTFGTSAHTSALLMVADEVTTRRNKDKQGRVSAFLVDLERRVDALELPAEVGDLVKSAARALLVRDAPGLERATKQLLSPFEQVIPVPVSTER
jgi:heme oxygenase